MKKPPLKLQVAGAVYNWALWLFIVLLVLTQFLSVFWNTTTRVDRGYYGRDPLDGLFPILGANDEPYSDRSFACVQQGRSYVPMTVNEAISFGAATIADATGTAINGYRVVKRDTAVLVPEALDAYATMCSLLAVTMDEILKTCLRLGYNVTQDSLRIVDDLNSKTMYDIQHSLPILIMPFWDNCGATRSAIPGRDGSACMFRLDGAFMSSGNPMPTMKAVNRTTREAKTVELLKRPGGQWKNGWYEDLAGMKWYSDVISTNLQSNPDIAEHQFNLLTGEELDCSDRVMCEMKMIEHWGSKFSSTITEIAMTSVAIANGERFGLFLYDGGACYVSKSIYNWESLLSNAVTVQILLHWMLVMIALQRGYFLGVSDWQNTGISCLANSYQFTFLPVLLLPRMKMTLVAFWSSGCRFEGQQEPFSQAWFLIYPSIVEVVLCYYSALNTLGKLLRFRISDKLFGVTLALLCVLHWSRVLVATSGWFEIDGRVATAFYADELQALTLVQLLTTNVAFRINGNLKSVFFIKVAILAAPLVPIAVGILSATQNGAAFAQISRVESILALRVCNSGGLGHLQSRKSAISPAKPPVQGGNPIALSQYELTRLGYLVYGNTLAGAEVFLISVDDWILLTQLAPLRKFTSLWNHRVKVFPILLHPDGGVWSIANESEMCRIDDPRLQRICWWHFHAQPVA